MIGTSLLRLLQRARHVKVLQDHAAVDLLHGAAALLSRTSCRGQHLAVRALVLLERQHALLDGVRSDEPNHARRPRLAQPAGGAWQWVQRNRRHMLLGRQKKDADA